MRDPYSVLGVAKTAKPAEIKSAFRKLAKKYHPDQNGGDPKAQEKFSEINQAYEILGDEEKRGQFDRGEIDAEGKPAFQGFAGGGPNAGGDPFAAFRQRGGGHSQFDFRSSGAGGFGGGAEDILNDLFGGAFGGGPRGAGRQTSRQFKGEDLKASIEISLEQALGAEKVEAVFPNGKHLAIKLPKYVEDGQTIRLKGQGEQPIGGTAGDALVTIRFKPHARFELKGRDLHMDLPVQLEDAILGGRQEVATLDGRIAVRIPEWSSSDKVLRLKQKGMLKKNGERADLFVHIQLMLPTEKDADLVEFFKKRSQTAE